MRKTQSGNGAALSLLEEVKTASEAAKEPHTCSRTIEPIRICLTFPTQHVYTCIVKTEMTTQAERTLPVLPCACANLRRATRAVTRLYNGQLQPYGIEVTQFTLLMALDRVGEISQGKLGKLLALDSTTLTRMLELLKKRGWIQEKEGDDRRFRMIRLTTAGRAKFQQSLPHWKRAQDRLRTTIGEQTMEQLGGLLVQVTALVVEH